MTPFFAFTVRVLILLVILAFGASAGCAVSLIAQPQAKYHQTRQFQSNTSSTNTSSHDGSIRFEHLSIEQGLSQSSVHAVVQDKRGFMWLGGQDGINKYDGYTFTTYRHRAGDTTTLSDNWITNLYEDQAGRLWVMTRNGLNLFNAAEENFRRFALPLVRAVSSDSLQNVYFGTVQGVFVFNHISGTMRQISSSMVFDIVCSGNSVLVAAIDGAWSIDGTRLIPLAFDARLTGKPVWTITAAGNDVFAMADTTAVHLHKSTRQVLATLPLSGMLNPRQNRFAILANPNGTVWLQTPLALILWQPRQQYVAPHNKGEKNNGQQNTVQVYLSASISRSAAPIMVNALARASNDALWVATTKGVWVIPQSSTSVPTDRKEPLVLSTDPTEPDALSDDQVLSLYQDRLGTMWVGTQIGGVNLWNPRRYKFQLVRHNPFNTNSPVEGGVYSMLHDAKGGLWVGTSKGLSYYDVASGQWLRFVTEPNNRHSLSFGFVTALLFDKRGRLWLTTRGGGVNRLDALEGSTGKAVFTRFLSNPTDSTTLASNSGWSMCMAHKSAPDGHIWIATQGGGLHLLDPNTGKMQRFRYDPKNPAGTVADSIRAVYEDSHGRLWLGTSGYGLMQFSHERGVVASYKSSGDSTSLSNNTVTGIFEDSRGVLWVTTAAGLNRFRENPHSTSPPQDRFERFTIKDGLPNEFVYGLREDDVGNLWMSTNNGLACLNPQTRVVKTFDVHDGLQSNEFNTGAFYKASDGTLYFGGVRGYNTFRPQTVLAYKPTTLPVVLISFKVHDEIRAFTQPLAEMRDITLPFHENKISFEFVALDFTGASAQIQYAYMLENFDAHWLQAGNRRYAAYTNLEPGVYRFRVRAGASIGSEGENASIVIRIQPPIWATWWFRVLALCGVVLLLWSAFQWRLRGIRRKNELLEREVEHRTEQLTKASEEIQRQNAQLHDQNIALELAIDELAQLNKEKNEFLGIAAHDLKNPLTGIMLTVQLMQNYRAKMSADDIKDSLQKVYQSAQRMFDIITNLLDINAIESGRFNFTIQPIALKEITGAVVEDYRARADAKNIALSYETIPPEGSSFLASADRTAVIEILENLLSNAIKYSPQGKRVWVWVLAGAATTIANELAQRGIALSREVPKCSIMVAVQDEGQGLSDKDKEHLFGRFAKLSARPTGGEHSTGLGLSIVKKMIEAMNGEVWCESEHGKGATFIVALPAATQD